MEDSRTSRNWMAEIQESRTGVDSNSEQDQMPKKMIWFKNAPEEMNVEEVGPSGLNRACIYYSLYGNDAPTFFLSYRTLSSNWNKGRTLIKTDVRVLEPITQSYWHLEVIPKPLFRTIKMGGGSLKISGLRNSPSPHPTTIDYCHN